MKTPPFLMGIALLFWGWQTGFLIWGVLFAALVESSRFTVTRWEFSDTDLNRIWDVCTILFLGTMVFIYTSDEIRYPAYVFPQSFPFIFLPMILAQAFGHQETIALRTFSWFLRKRNQSHWANKRINISYLYFSACILGASTTNPSANSAAQTAFWFYFGMALLCGWALMAVRPRRISLPAWLVLFTLVAYGGFVGQTTLRNAQSLLETAVGNWFGALVRHRASEREANTFIGQIGRLKLSGRIILKVKPQVGPAPDLLREASYNVFNRFSWRVDSNEFSTITIVNDAATLLPPKKNPSLVNIAGYLQRGAGILALPHGTFELSELPALMKTNQFGVASVEAGPGFLSFVAHFAPGSTADTPPGPQDRDLPPEEDGTLAYIAEELDLNSKIKTDEEKLRLIRSFFADRFTYSLYTPPQQDSRWRGGRSGGSERRRIWGATTNFIETWNKAFSLPTFLLPLQLATSEHLIWPTPISRFLLETRSGHCEYFATAAVLLARQAGIPARYAAGFAVDEMDGSGKSYIVRERHAHSWALVYREEKGVWENFDTTPAGWEKVDSQRASFWEPLRDVWTKIWFEFSRWRYSKISYRQYLVWLLVPLVLVLVWRIMFRHKRHRSSPDQFDSSRSHLWPGLDSEFYLVEKKLAAFGLAREEGEPLVQWQKRVENSPLGIQQPFHSIVLLHEKYRFDPNGINETERRELQENVSQCLASLKEAPTTNNLN